jgi:cytidylate kinase
MEHERARFLKSHYRADASGPNRHDLIINFETFDLDQTVELIMGALRTRGIVD